VLLVEVRRKVGWEDGWGCSEHMGEEGGERKEVEESRRAELCDIVLWGMRGRERRDGSCRLHIQDTVYIGRVSSLSLGTGWLGRRFVGMKRANAAELELCV
jgi:hypothetical protein